MISERFHGGEGVSFRSPCCRETPGTRTAVRLIGVVFPVWSQISTSVGTFSGQIIPLIEIIFQIHFVKLISFQKQKALQKYQNNISNTFCKINFFLKIKGSTEISELYFENL